MITNLQISQLASLLHGKAPMWDLIRTRYEQLPPSISERPRLIQQYAQEFSEIILDLNLEEIAKSEMSTQLTFLTTHTKSNPLCHYKDRLYSNPTNRLILESIKYGNWEYDQLIKTHQIPVILEMKLRDWKKGKQRKRRFSDGSFKLEKDTCVQNNLRPEVYTRKLQPIENFFERKVGYIIIVSKDQYERSQRSTDNSIASNFLNQGGHIVPFYTDRITFREEVAQKAMEWGYQIKPEPVQHTKYFSNQPPQE